MSWQLRWKVLSHTLCVCCSAALPTFPKHCLSTQEIAAGRESLTAFENTAWLNGSRNVTYRKINRRSSKREILPLPIFTFFIMWRWLCTGVQWRYVEDYFKMTFVNYVRNCVCFLKHDWLILQCNARCKQTNSINRLTDGQQSWRRLDPE